MSQQLTPLVRPAPVRVQLGKWALAIPPRTSPRGAIPGAVRCRQRRARVPLRCAWLRCVNGRDAARLRTVGVRCFAALASRHRALVRNSDRSAPTPAVLR